MCFFRPKRKNCILEAMLEILASSRLLRTSSLPTVFPVPYHLSTVHLVLTAKWPALAVVASKSHAQERFPRSRRSAFFGAVRAACSSVQSHADSCGLA